MERGEPDLNRTMVRTSCYAAWFAELTDKAVMPND